MLGHWLEVALGLHISLLRFNECLLETWVWLKQGYSERIWCLEWLVSGLATGLD